jgi:hypothetical protein
LNLLGQPVLVYPNGVTWKDPETKNRYMIGTTRLEAERFLKAWLDERDRSCRNVRALPKLEDGSPIPRPYWRALHYARARAKRANVPIMSAEEYASLVVRSKGACELTGIEFSYEKPAGHRKAMWGPSIDRIDCRGDYQLGNCRLVSVAVNLALNEFGIDVLKRITLAFSEMEKAKRAPPAC